MGNRLGLIVQTITKKEKMNDGKSRAPWVELESYATELGKPCTWATKKEQEGVLPTVKKK